MPQISLKPWLSGDAAGKAQVAKEIGDAATNIGFFGIVDHGFPDDVLRACWDDVRAFFDLPEEEKKKLVSPDEATYPYGYVGFGGEDLQAGMDTELGKEHVARPDLKECISLGPYNPASGMPPPVFPKLPPTFEQNWMAYYQAMENLSGEMLHVFAAALGLEENWFDNKVDKHRSALRAL